jgi:hypothetical protein
MASSVLTSLEDNSKIIVVWIAPPSGVVHYGTMDFEVR